MSFLNLGERKTSAEWRLEEEGLMSFFRDEYDDIPITRGEWKDGSYRPLAPADEKSRKAP
jgi:hypothetical protein